MTSLEFAAQGLKQGLLICFHATEADPHRNEREGSAWGLQMPAIRHALSAVGLSLLGSAATSAQVTCYQGNATVPPAQTPPIRSHHFTSTRASWI